MKDMKHLKILHAMVLFKNLLLLLLRISVYWFVLFTVLVIWESLQIIIYCPCSSLPLTFRLVASILSSAKAKLLIMFGVENLAEKKTTTKIMTFDSL